MRRILPKKRRAVEKEGPPRFIYPLVALALASWAGWGYLLFIVPPEGITARALFLAALFFGLFFTLAFLSYEIVRFIRPADRPHEIVARWGRRSFFIAAFFTLCGVMVLLGIANPFNIGLFGLILFLAEVQLSRR